MNKDPYWTCGCCGYGTDGYGINTCSVPVMINFYYFAGPCQLNMCQAKFKSWTKLEKELPTAIYSRYEAIHFPGEDPDFDIMIECFLIRLSQVYGA